VVPSVVSNRVLSFEDDLDDPPLVRQEDRGERTPAALERRAPVEVRRGPDHRRDGRRRHDGAVRNADDPATIVVGVRKPGTSRPTTCASTPWRRN
jgi:hypothetical protein